MDGNEEGPLVQCRACGTTQRGYMHFAQGWVCRGCVGSASTIIEWRWINGEKYMRCLKGLAPKQKPAVSAAG